MQSSRSFMRPLPMTFPDGHMKGFTHGWFTFYPGHTALICLISLKAELIPFHLMLNGLFIWSQKPEGCWGLFMKPCVHSDWQQLQILTIKASNCFSDWAIRAAWYQLFISGPSPRPCSPCQHWSLCAFDKRQNLLQDCLELVLFYYWLLSGKESEWDGSVCQVCFSLSPLSFVWPIKSSSHFLLDSTLCLFGFYIQTRN